MAGLLMHDAARREASRSARYMPPARRPLLVARMKPEHAESGRLYDEAL